MAVTNGGEALHLTPTGLIWGISSLDLQLQHVRTKPQNGFQGKQRRSAEASGGQIHTGSFRIQEEAAHWPACTLSLHQTLELKAAPEGVLASGPGRCQTGGTCARVLDACAAAAGVEGWVGGGGCCGGGGGVNKQPDPPGAALQTPGERIKVRLWVASPDPPQPPVGFPALSKQHHTHCRRQTRPGSARSSRMCQRGACTRVARTFRCSQSAACGLHSPVSSRQT